VWGGNSGTLLTKGKVGQLQPPITQGGLGRKRLEHRGCATGNLMMQQASIRQGSPKGGRGMKLLRHWKSRNSSGTDFSREMAAPGEEGGQKHWIPAAGREGTNDTR
jgi:hypothetical protein